MSKTNDIATVSDAGIESLVRAYMSVNTICLPAGHYRVEEGSEHYLFYALEKRLGKTFIHGHIVGLGVYIMSRLQNNKHGKVVEFMESVGLKYHPRDMGLGRREVSEALLGLGEFVRSRDDLWYTVIDETQWTQELVDSLLHGLQFSDENKI